MVGLGMTEVALERAVTLKVCDSLGAPELMPVSATTCGAAFSRTTMLGSGSSVGGSFTGLTVTMKASLAEAPSASATITVIVVVPNWSAAGVIWIVRLVPLPANTMFAGGTRLVLDELPAIIRLDAGVSLSVTMNGTEPVEVSSEVDRFGMGEIDGGLFSASAGSVIRPLAQVVTPRARRPHCDIFIKCEGRLCNQTFEFL